MAPSGGNRRRKMEFMGVARMALKHFRLTSVGQLFRRNVQRTRMALLDSGQRTCCTDAPLNGVRVLDLTRVLAGPYCTMILGDLGADVIKVERPGVGDDTRSWTPPWVENESAYFLSVNRNKKSVAVDIKSKAGVDILKQLVLKSDILVENYLPGKLGEFGLGYDQLKEAAPHLIYCSISGYGQTGPQRHKAGYDVIAAGGGGLMHITGPEEGEPCRVGVAVTDLSTGLYAHGAIMAALIQRYKTGRGQHIDCNLLSTQVATLTHIGSNYLNAGLEARRYGNGHGSIVPYQVFQAADGYIIVGCGNNAHFIELCKKMDLEELIEDPRYVSNEKRVVNRMSLIKTLSDRLAEKTSAEWFELFEGSNFPNGPINNMEQVFSDQQVLHNGLVQEMDHSTVGKIRVPGPAVRYSEAAVVLQRPPPTLGQHTDDVLKDVLNMDDQTIQCLRKSKAIA